MIHYHGTPITPKEVLYDLAGRHFCCSFQAPQDVARVHAIGQSVMLDNGAFSAWTKGRRVDWQAWAEWVEPWLEYRTTWAVLPDSIEGSEGENDHLIAEWAWMLAGRGRVVPVWHLHENLTRLVRLSEQFGAICFGCSGQYAIIGSVSWHRRVSDAFDTLDREFGIVPWVHMLRGMSLAGSQYPFASVDSTDVARNHSRPHQNALKMAARWDAIQCPARWERSGQLAMEVVACDTPSPSV
jgi:hypothetical protein